MGVHLDTVNETRIFEPKALFLRFPMFELLNKVIDFVAAHPSSVIAVLVAVAVVCVVATPVLSLALAGYVIRALVRREPKGEGR